MDRTSWAPEASEVAIIMAVTSNVRHPLVWQPLILQLIPTVRRRTVNCRAKHPKVVNFNDARAVSIVEQFSIPADFNFTYLFVSPLPVSFFENGLKL